MGLTPTDFPVILLVLLVLGNLLVAPDPGGGLVKTFNVGIGAAAYFAISRLVRGSGNGLLLAHLLYAGAGIALATFGLFATDWSQKLLGLERITARLPRLVAPVNGAGVNPNELGGVLLWLAPVSLAAALAMFTSHPRVAAHGQRAVAAVLLLSSFLAWSVLILSQSRAALIGAVAAVATIGLMAARWPRQLVALVVLSAFGGLWLAASGGTATDGSGTSVQERVELWRRAWAIMMDFPFTGVGLNGFRRIMPLLYPLPGLPSGADIAHAHNTWLQLGAELGIPGLAAYLLVWCSALKVSVAVARRGQTSLVRATGVGGLASLVGFTAYGMLDTISLGALPGMVLWVLLGLLAAAWRTAQRTSIP